MISPAVNPYVGPFSFQFEDRHLYFGRTDQTEHFIGLVASSRVTVLHAQSGAGKTSLLNARILPALDAMDLVPARCTPENNPMEAIAAAVVRDGLLHPGPEALCITHAMSALGVASETEPVAALLERFRGLDLADGRRRTLCQPVPLTAGLTLHGRLTGSVRPHFSRVLSGVLSLGQWLTRVHAAWGRRDPERLDPATTSISDLLQLLSAGHLLDAYAEILAALSVPFQSLEAFFVRRHAILGRNSPGLGLCVVIDQFEEIFARFTELKTRRVRRRAGEPDWRLKHRFFEEFDELLHTEVLQGETGATRVLLPVKFVISLREEYLARLQPLSEALGDLADCSMRLDPLSRAEARDAIEQPAQICAFEVACAEELLQDLVTENRYVEPTHLQISCNHLWKSAIRPQLEGLEPMEGKPRVSVAHYELQDRAIGILKFFLNDFFEKLTDLQRFEAASLLAALITSHFTRNIVERSALVQLPFRNVSLRNEMLNQLVKHAIVRIEPRVGGEFAEVTHEFLIESILDIVQAIDADPRFRDLQRVSLAASTCATGQGSSSWEEFSSADLGAVARVRSWLHWDAGTAEAVFRSSVVRGADEDLIRHAAERLEGQSIPVWPLSEAANRPPPSPIQWRGCEPHWRAEELDSADIEFALRRALELSTGQDEDRLVYWASRAKALK